MQNINYSDYNDVFNHVDRLIDEAKKPNEAPHQELTTQITEAFLNSIVPLSKIKFSRAKTNKSAISAMLNAQRDGIILTLDQIVLYTNGVDKSKYAKDYLDRFFHKDNFIKQVQEMIEWGGQNIISNEEDMPDDILTENQFAEIVQDIIDKVIRHPRYGSDIRSRYRALSFYDKRTNSLGLCSNNGHISFNRLLLKIDPKLSQSVIYHELAHLYEFNHSPRFYNILYGWFPDYDEVSKKCHKVYSDLRALRKRGKSIW